MHITKQHNSGLHTYLLWIDKLFDALENLVAVSIIDFSLSNACSVTSYAFLGKQAV